MNVKKRANSSLNSFEVFKKSHLIAGGFFLFLMMGCQSFERPPLQQVSALDQRYRLERHMKGTKASPSVQTYRQVVAKTLYSHCKWFPSDSRYAQTAQNRCGGVKGGMMAFSRFMMEEDAIKMGYPVINNHDHIESVDFPDECWF